MEPVTLLLGAAGAAVLYNMMKKKPGETPPVPENVPPGMVATLEKGRTYLVQANLNVEKLMEALTQNPNSPEAMMLRQGSDNEAAVKNVGAFLSMIFDGMGFKLTGGALGTGSVPVPLNPTEKKKFLAGAEIADARMRKLPAGNAPVDMNSTWAFAGQWTKDAKYIDTDIAKKVPYITGMTTTMMPVG